MRTNYFLQSAKKNNDEELIRTDIQYLLGMLEYANLEQVTKRKKEQFKGYIHELLHYLQLHLAAAKLQP